MIDWHQVATLRAEVGSDDFGEVVSLFLQEAEAALCELRDDPDQQLLESRLHALKGAAMTLGFSNLATLCRQGEARAANGDPVPIAPIMILYQGSKAAFCAKE